MKIGWQGDSGALSWCGSPLVLSALQGYASRHWGQHKCVYSEHRLRRLPYVTWGLSYAFTLWYRFQISVKTLESGRTHPVRYWHSSIAKMYVFLRFNHPSLDNGKANYSCIISRGTNLTMINGYIYITESHRPIDYYSLSIVVNNSWNCSFPINTDIFSGVKDIMCKLMQVWQDLVTS